MFPPEPDPIVSIPACEPQAAPDSETPTGEPQPSAPPDLHTQIAALLSQSRAAHDRKKKAAGLTDKDGKITRPSNWPEAEAEMREALRLREEAHALDPDHTAPAWLADQIANKGLTHQQMCDWMREYETIP